MENTKWLIWSIEHGGWWCPDRCGYAEGLWSAGVYSYEDALSIVKGANYCLTLEKSNKKDKKLNVPYEAMILLTPEIATRINPENLKEKTSTQDQSANNANPPAN